MSWVLILGSPYTNKPYAVVGGYPTQEEAEQAGELATAANETSWPEFTGYTVIPGAACSGPVGASHGHIERYYDAGKTTITRHFNRWPK
jgi:hypothetical protein